MAPVKVLTGDNTQLETKIVAAGVLLPPLCPLVEDLQLLDLAVQDENVLLRPVESLLCVLEFFL